MNRQGDLPNPPGARPDLILYGAGGHGRVVLDIARACGYPVRMFIDDHSGHPVHGVPVAGPAHLEALLEREVLAFVASVGDNRKRAEVFARFAARARPVCLVHPFTSVSVSAEIHAGVVIMPGAVIGADARIFENSIINTSASVDHDCIIEAHAHLCPGVHLAGKVRVGSGTMIGTGSSVIPGIRIGQNCLIGAGATVVEDIPDHSVAYGTPARVVRQNQNPRPGLPA